MSSIKSTMNLVKSDFDDTLVYNTTLLNPEFTVFQISFYP